MELPTHPDTDDPTSARGHGKQPSNGTGLGSKLFVAVIIALFVLLVLLHLTGVVGPGAH